MAKKEEDLAMPDTRIPDVIYDQNTGTSYKKGRFFGKGGFAKCYEIIEMTSKQIYAGKIVSKKILVKSNQKEKMTQEINIHRSLKHPNIVGFHSFFDDSTNVYIVLELCRKRSMMEMQKRRKKLTEPEVRFFLHQILVGVHYLHKKNIIHRDLKLGNLFLSDDLSVKIGDFGLAARVEYQGERKRTLCGTPNYIAPEILTKKGHSFEVDVWSIGCIMYTLLFGKPPFETTSLKETYSLIKKCQYCIPPQKVSKEAKSLIQAMLQSEPKLRPKVEDILGSDFMKGYMPNSLPVSCLSTQPLFEGTVSRKPLLEVNTNDDGSGNCVAGVVSKKPGLAYPQNFKGMVQEVHTNLKKLKNLLLDVLKSKPGDRSRLVYGDEMTDPAAQPIVWVSKWVDYSDKYGFGYMLCDESVGVVFNDDTKLVMLADGLNVHYITMKGEESYHTVKCFPFTLDKKMKLLSYFHRYMKENLAKAGASVAPRDSDALSRIPWMFQFSRDSNAVIMHLNNGTVQNVPQKSIFGICLRWVVTDSRISETDPSLLSLMSAWGTGRSPLMRARVKSGWDKVVTCFLLGNCLVIVTACEIKENDGHCFEFQLCVTHFCWHWFLWVLPLSYLAFRRWIVCLALGFIMFLEVFLHLGQNLVARHLLHSHVTQRNLVTLCSRFESNRQKKSLSKT